MALTCWFDEVLLGQSYSLQAVDFCVEELRRPSSKNGSCHAHDMSFFSEVVNKIVPVCIGTCYNPVAFVNARSNCYKFVIV